MKTLLKTKLVSHTGYRWIIVAIFGTVAAQPSLAATYGLENEWCLNPPANSSTCGRSGIQQSGPITNTVTNTYTSPSSPGSGATFSGTMTDTSSYGSLSASGSATVSNGTNGGALGFDGPYVGGAPLAWYTDTLTITGAGPVSIQFTDVFSASVTFAGNASASISDQLSVDGNTWHNTQNSSGTATDVLTFTPGDPVVITEGLYGGGWASANSTPPPLLTSSFSYSGSGPLYIDVLTVGGGYTAASGTLYPNIAAVPEPESYAMMLAGLGLMGFMVRSKKSA